MILQLAFICQNSGQLCARQLRIRNGGKGDNREGGVGNAGDAMGGVRGGDVSVMGAGDFQEGDAGVGGVSVGGVLLGHVLMGDVGMGGICAGGVGGGAVSGGDTGVVRRVCAPVIHQRESLFSSPGKC